MRSVAAAGFVVLGFGCNSILGLDPTTLYPDAQPARILISRQALTSVPDGVELSPLENLDKIKLAPMDAPFDDHPCSEQPPPCTQSFDGIGFPIPAALVGQTYRMLYQPQGDPIPHEVQWSFTAPNICVPYFGKTGQPDAPTDAQVQITATMHPGAFDTPRVFSYGTTWTSGGFTQANPGNPATYEYTTNATPIDGPLSTLQKSSDTAMLVDFTAGSSTGGVRFKVDLQAGPTPVAVSGMWLAQPTENITFEKDTGDWLQRLFWMGATLAGSPGTRSMIYAGVLPSSHMPAFAIRPSAAPLDPLAVPMFALAQLTSLPPMDTQTATFVDPFDTTDPLPRAVAYQANNQRSIDGVSVSHVFQWAFLESQLSGTVPITATQVGVPQAVTLNGTRLEDNTTTHMGDKLVIALGGMSHANLAFDLDHPADECVATLYQIDAGSLAALRSFQAPTTTPPIEIQIDTSVFVGPATTKYVFGIQCRAGLPDARTSGDQSRIEYPFSTVTEFPSAFTVVR